MSSFFARRKAQKEVMAKIRSAPSGGNTASGIQFFETKYTSGPVNISSSFLKSQPALPVTYSRIDWSSTSLPEYENSYAVVLDNVLSSSECEELITLAEQSAGAGSDSEGIVHDGWKPALVNAGQNREFLSTEYRNSDRIIWDEKEIVDRIWARCLLAHGLEDYLKVLEGETYASVIGPRAVASGTRWKLTRLNERMRFLRYGEGQYFREHCDGCYETPDGRERSWYTLHLYLNDSAQEKEKIDGIAIGGIKEENGEEMLRGGATTFHSYTEGRTMDVDPKAGRVLIFQHKGLLHSGDTVIEGVKYTLRTDLMFERDAASVE